MATFQTSVSADDDDAQQDHDGGGFVADSDPLFVTASTFDNIRSHVGLRFQNVTIPNAAPITSAILTLRTGSNDDPLLSIFCEDVDDADDFAGTADIVGRTLTSASAVWNASNVGTNTNVDTPDFASAVQEVIDRAGWASGNALMVILFAGTSLARILSFAANESVTLAAPILTIVYTDVGALAGSQPASTGALTKKYLINLAGVQSLAGSMFLNFTAVNLSGSLSFTKELDILNITDQVSPPTIDVQDGGWLPSAMGADLYAMIDESITDDGDYIYYTGSGSPAIVQLEPMSTPTPGAVTMLIRTFLPHAPPAALMQAGALGQLAFGQYDNPP